MKDARPTLRRSLHYADLVVYGLAYIAPFALLSTLGFVWQSSHGLIVLAYLLSTCCMYFTAKSYAVMCDAVPQAGSVYGFARHALGRLPGFIAGWMILLDYLLVPAFLYLIVAVGVGELVPSMGRGTSVLLIASLTLAVNWFGIEVSSRVNFFSVGVQVIVLAGMMILGVVALRRGFGTGGLTLAPVWNPSVFSLGAMASATSICIMSFLGFDAISTLSEEVAGDDPRLVGRAIVSTLLIAAAFFTVGAYVLGNLLPGIVLRDPAAAQYELATAAIGPWATTLIAWTSVAIVGVANALPMQVGVARVLFAMGRDRQLPYALSRVHPIHGTPWVSMIASTLVSTAVALAMLRNIDELTNIVNFGALCAFLMLHVSVIVEFGIRQRSRRWFVHWLTPILGAIVVLMVLQGMSPVAATVGLLWLVAGLVWGIVLQWHQRATRRCQCRRRAYHGGHPRPGARLTMDHGYLSASDAIRRFRAGEDSPVRVMQSLLDRAERLAPTVNATTAIHAETSLRAARESERRYHAGTARPLEGIAVAVKEEMSVAGWHKAVGSLLVDEVPTAHHPMVDKLLAAGAIPHLQTTVPEFCLIGQTLSRRFGVTRNPWNLTMTPGGSSGGSGAALAAGLAPLATGSDMGGSIRIPAALCGVYGFKPPFGRLAAVPGEELFTFAVDGPMARSFDDLLLMQNIVAGPHPATYTGMPFQPLPSTFPPLTGTRIGLAFTTGNGGLCPDTRRNLERACKALEQQGAVIEPIELDWDSNDIGNVLIESIFGLFFEEFLEALPPTEIPKGTTYLHWLMRRYCGRRNSILKGARLALALHQELDQKLWSRGLAALVCPTVFTTAIRADMDLVAERVVDVAGHAADSYLGWVGTPPFNLVSRYPVIAAPTGLAANGMPTSMQIVGPPFADEVVFKIASHHARGPGSELYTRKYPTAIGDPLR